MVRWNSSTMRRWLKENNLAPGTGRAKGGNMVVSLDDLANPNIGMPDSVPDPRSGAKSTITLTYTSGNAPPPGVGGGSVGPRPATAPKGGMPAHLRPPLINTGDNSKSSGPQAVPMNLLRAPLPSPTRQVDLLAATTR